jgi:hypothetical protein
MKTLVALLLFFAFFNTIQSQNVDRSNFRAGINAGLVTGDFSEAYSLALGLDVYQHWGVSREVDLGLATGFLNAFGEKQEIGVGGTTVTTEFGNVQFIPLAGSFRLYPSSGFKLGGDIGYALGINDGNSGGLYYRPSIGVDMNGGTTELHVSYFAVNDEITFSAFLAGILILF